MTSFRYLFLRTIITLLIALSLAIAVNTGQVVNPLIDIAQAAACNTQKGYVGQLEPNFGFTGKISFSLGQDGKNITNIKVSFTDSTDTTILRFPDTHLLSLPQGNLFKTQIRVSKVADYFLSAELDSTGKGFSGTVNRESLTETDFKIWNWTAKLKSVN